MNRLKRLLAFRPISSEISVTQAPKEEANTRDPATGQLKTQTETIRLRLTRTAPNLSANITIVNDFLKRQSTVTIHYQGHFATVDQATATARFLDFAVKKAKKMAKFRIEN
jgi:hypothetical protein